MSVCKRRCCKSVREWSGNKEQFREIVSVACEKKEEADIAATCSLVSVWTAPYALRHWNERL